MDATLRTQITDEIRRNGSFAYFVFGGPSPIWLYTIGLWETFGHPEIVLAGSAFPNNDERGALLKGIRERVGRGDDARTTETWDLPGLGHLGFGPVDTTWKELLLLGAIDYYYAPDAFEVVQVIPPPARRGLDVPDMSRSYDPALEPEWGWLTESWPYRIPEATMVFTEFSVLCGRQARLVIHEDDGDWQAIASPDLPPDDAIRLVPLGTLVARDPSLAEILNMNPGEYAERTDEGAWTIYV